MTPPDPPLPPVVRIINIVNACTAKIGFNVTTSSQPDTRAVADYVILESQIIGGTSGWMPVGNVSVLEREVDVRIPGDSENTLFAVRGRGWSSKVGGGEPSTQTPSSTIYQRRE